MKVFGVPSDFFGEEVAACIKLIPGAEWNEDRAREALSETLAKYKTPRYFCLFDEFPLLGSGKIDGAELRQELLRRILQKS